MTTRRGFIGGLLAASTAPRLGWASVGSPAFLAAAREPDGSYALHGLTSAGIETFSIPLPDRGHAACGHPTRAEAIGFARRPGRFALVLDCATGQVIHQLGPPDGRVFQGHGAYSGDGSLLFTCEQEEQGSIGHIGVWETDGYRRIDSFATTGIGPHEIRLMPDGRSLVIANGGIETVGREKVNLDRMRPSLVYTDLSGRVMDRVELEPSLARNSIRHLAIRQDGLVGFAMQWQGELGATVPLLGLHRVGEMPTLAAAPSEDERAMEGYAGSVAFAGTGAEIAITSPRGGRLHRFSASGEFIAAFRRSDVCGLAALGDGYLASDGLGGLIALDNDRPRVLSRAPCSWDNHLIAI
ncbi:DUF1513 domain-containing protein [Maritimibacter dapengensis]|uniref:DUF1513 domain-containing protein n=1 Tax=Maritimibacter dapengensis TaxID=2836868 RepID=A0ABS6T426_9RHOB|nr:DUF1513 domain-containing protein [Maritimibacter dapengensis]MBV7379988.1 DUF1513 domain-containing protein [Maritimibacter dapengensis]